MEYRPDKKSTYWFSFKLSLYFLLIIPYYPLIGIILFTICFSLIFTITYKYTTVFYNNNFLIITRLNKAKQYNLNDLYLNKHFSRIENRQGYWFMGKFREFKKPSSLPIFKILNFIQKENKTTKYAILSFLEINDFMDLKERIINNQNKKNNIIDINNLNNIINNKCEYNIKSKKIKNTMDKTYKRCLLYSLLCIIFFIIIYITLYSNISFIKNDIILSIIYIFSIPMMFFISINLPKILVTYQIKQIKNKVPSTIKIEQNLKIDETKIEFIDVEIIYINSYFDNLGNEVKCLVIHTKKKKYIYCIDYIIDNDVNFEYFENLCNILKKIFKTTFSNNIITR